MLDGNFTVLIGRSLSIGCKCHIRVLQDVILEVHNGAFSTNKQNCILVIKHTNFIGGKKLSTANLLIGGVVTASPGTFSESVGINGFLAEKLGHIFVSALLVTAEI